MLEQECEHFLWRRGRRNAYFFEPPKNIQMDNRVQSWKVPQTKLPISTTLTMWSPVRGGDITNGQIDCVLLMRKLGERSSSNWKEKLWEIFHENFKQAVCRFKSVQTSWNSLKPFSCHLNRAKKGAVFLMSSTKYVINKCFGFFLKKGSPFIQDRESVCLHKWT